MRRIFLGMALLIPFFVSAQTKKPLDHTVYDSWQTIGEKLISNNGKWVLYTIDPQEGDGELVIQSTGTLQKKVFPGAMKAALPKTAALPFLRLNLITPKQDRRRSIRRNPKIIPRIPSPYWNWARTVLLK